MRGKWRGAWQTFQCDAFKHDDLTDDYRYYLRDDYALDCESAEYAQVRNWAYGLIFLWPAGACARVCVCVRACVRARAFRLISASCSTCVWLCK